MNRHHPYGGYEERGRRSASPIGGGGGGRGYPRSDYRGGRGGRGRGGPRGGYGGGRGGGGGGGGGGYGGGPGGYDNHYQDGYQDNSYNQGFGGGGFNDSQGYGSGGIDAASNGGYGYDQGSANEDNPRNRPPVPPRRRERDDKVHDSLIEERIQRERPCRTLFIRNIKYETDSGDVRRQFEEHGEIKTFFDLISNRGMVFVTYYDLRAAERARERLQGTEIAGRPIDVHYSLPRGDEQTSRCERDKNQGTLLVTLRDSPSGHIDDNEVRRKFQQFGDVKTVKPFNDRPDQRLVEMYDTRATEEAHDRLRHQGLQDGVMDIIFAWDVPDEPLPPGPIPKRHDDHGGPGHGRDFDEYRDRPARGRGRGRGRGNYDGGWENRDREDWGRRDRPGRYEDDGYNGRGGYRGGSGGYDERHGGGRNHDSSYGASSSNYPSYNNAQQPPPPPPVDDRLEQAKKVQQLLAALKGPQTGGAPSGSAPPAPAPAGPAPGGNPPYFTPPPHSAYVGVPPPSQPNPYGNYGPPPSQAQQPPAAALPAAQPPGAVSAAALAALPPAVLSLLQQNALLAQGQGQASAPAPAQHFAPAPPPPSAYPPSNIQAQPPPGQSPASNSTMQHLLSLLSAQQQKRN
ncbi:hypothetical protein BOTBODRAFT_31511 [Botryobasidium botryosum FD-172 SS1]|uniref:RRM domain-containing protein n=1 Tax=Botryobasidium botryosum (strain FD-172 SS1) TaxID=930990 RepID=A0A067MVM5_BOTB1|nr:hypothetical protein BOTBODRAFT_31511 [Botryobasidium botryosum FD-172 SS1]